MTVDVAENLMPSQPAPRARRRFPKDVASDRIFYPLFIAGIWGGIAAGFGPELVQHVRGGEAPYPLIVHLHAAAFTGWVLLLMTQSLLIRTGRWQIHRRLGTAAIGLAAIMLFLGPAVALAIQRQQLGLAHPSPIFGNPAFLAVQFGGMIDFAILLAAGLLLRANASAHRRLMLLATLAITDAGFARATAPWIHQTLAPGFWTDFAGLYGANFAMILLLGVYDLITRQRLHPAWVAGASYLFASEFVAELLQNNAAWKAFATHLVTG
ncbi:MAG TPA: hypothetical protein VHZ32_08675 [Rhizomicrobium sp.]|nr:hypothetical protein [Rhizomicrobium sp.]